MTRRLDYPAPKSCSYQLPDGSWCTRAWTVSDVEKAKASGSWFVSGRHNFASKDAIESAGLSPARENAASAMERLLARLPEDQLDILRSMLAREVEK